MAKGSEFGPQTRADAIEQYTRGLLTGPEFDSEYASFGEPEVRDVILPRDMRVGDLLEPTFGMGMPWRTAVVERIDGTLVHLARPYASVSNPTGSQAIVLLGTEHYPLELSSRHLAYVLVERNVTTG